MKFETAWKEEFKYYERCYDEKLGKSIKREIKPLFEWYEPNSIGMYTSVIDDTIKLTKKESYSSKEGRDKHGFLDPLYKSIRDNYWNKDLYCTDANIWYLDIETRSSASYKNPGSDKKIKIKNKETNTEYEESANKLRSAFKNGKEENFLYFNSLENKWEELKGSYYFQRNIGFPVPEKSLEEIVLMQFYDKNSKTMYVIGDRDWKHKDDYDFQYNLKFINAGSELEIIETYLKLFKALDPLIIYAWNGMGFDYPYIHNRLKKLGIDPNRLSNYGNVSYSEREFQGKIEFRFRADGHHYIDLMEVYKNFVFKPRASYSLNAIAEVEVNDKKVNHTEYKRFDDFYLGNYEIPLNPTEEQKNSKIYNEAIAGNWAEVRELAYSDFCYYGAKDTYLLVLIDNKLKFTQLQFMIAEKMGVLLSDATATVKPWSQYIANMSYLENKVLPPRTEHGSPHVVGGYVKDPQKGKHKWVMSADVNSMYPLLSMVGFNMSPETYVPMHKVPSDLKEILLTYFNDQDEGKRLELDKNIWAKTTELLQKYNYSLGINGAVFTKDKLGMIPKMIMDIYTARKVAKKEQFKYEQQKVLIKEIISKYNCSNQINITHSDVLEYTKEELENLSLDTLKDLALEAESKENEYNTRQLVLKVQINGLYGALANTHFPLFNEQMAAAITGNGRYFIQKKSNYIESKLQGMIPSQKPYIIYNDTDAAYYHIEPFMNKYQEQNSNLTIEEYTTWANSFEEKVIQPTIQHSVDDFAHELNAYNKDVIKSEREVISDSALWVAKKKYLARVRDSEGTRYPDDNPYMKAMGLEIAKSSTSVWAKKKLKESINKILDGTEEELSNWIKELKIDFVKVDLNDLAQVGAASNLDYDLSDKGVPFGSRAAICHNIYIKEYNKDETYSPIQAGEKTKRLFLIEPNPLKTNIIAYSSDNFVNEIKDYIDYDTNFEKSFLNPLQLMVECLNWDLNKKTESLDDW